MQANALMTYHMMLNHHHLYTRYLTGTHEMSVNSEYSDHEKSNIEENLTQFHGNSPDQDNLDLEIKQEEAIHTNDVFHHQL